MFRRGAGPDVFGELGAFRDARDAPDDCPEAAGTPFGPGLQEGQNRAGYVFATAPVAEGRAAGPSAESRG
ncbi:MAG: hypothetical protein LBT40_03715 [Deltaproteobacteria bacterium]|nr:hypothetical protein [Deltaproteobacteria bacterium]